MSSQIPDGMNIAEMINFIIKSMPAEDPLKYLGKELYTSTNPAFIQFGIEKAKEKAAQLNNKKGTKEVNIFFEFGQEQITSSRISGFFSGILFIEDYIRSKGPTLGITPSEIKTFTDVMRKAGLPTIVDAYKPEGVTYTTKTYEAVLSAWLLWLSRASVANRQGGDVMRSNNEVCNLLASVSLSQYPGMPFSSYYIATIKTNEDIPTLAEKMYKGVKFDKYISDEWAAVNEPKFTVRSVNAPVGNMALHPLVFNAVGMADANSNTVDFFAGFSGNREFDKLCMKNNISSKDVAKYIISTSLEQHKKNIEAKHPVAVFINEQKIIGQAFEQLRTHDGLLKLASEKKDYVM